VGVASKIFDQTNVEIFPAEGVLRLRLSITPDLHSSGGLVYTAAKYGYGTYEWCARMSSTSATPAGPGDPLSGGVSAGFIYVNNSQTEVDFEFAHATDSLGRLDAWLYMANWRNLVSTSSSDRNADPPVPYHTGYQIFKFVWTRNYIHYYVNGSLLRIHRQNIPRVSAHVMANHWGTNSDGFGGPAAPGVRYFYVDWVRYTPPGGSAAAIPCGP